LLIVAKKPIIAAIAWVSCWIRSCVWLSKRRLKQQVSR